MTEDLKATSMPADLSSWLNYIERLHPKSIAMGLERVQLVIQQLALNSNFKKITVAGTNGKGSTCAMLAQIYIQAGYRVGCYTSPHLLRYNERVKVNGIEASDNALCAAFVAIEKARHDAGPEGAAVALTYFEVGTLAAMWHFSQIGIDVAILEIGLGGRLDAVNAFEPDCSIVTSIDIDHQEFLGDTRELIGLEKAGVYRANKPAICGDINPPKSLITYANKINADLMCINDTFGFKRTLSTSTLSWDYLSGGQVVRTLPLPALQGEYQLNNASCAVAAVEALQKSLPVSNDAIAQAMTQVTLTGRFQTVSKSPWLILDVAHNPHAALALARNLKALRLQQDGSNIGLVKAKTAAVFAMLADKNIKGVINALKDEIDTWYVAGIEHARGATANDLAVMITEITPAATIKTFNTAADACKQACIDIEACIDKTENDKIVAFGSFFTVSSVMQYLSEHQLNNSQTNASLRKQ